MPPNDRDKLNRIEELKSQLFSKGYKTKIEHRDSFSNPEKSNVPESWDDGTKDRATDKFFMKTSLFKKFFLFSLVFFVLTLIYASYIFFAGGNTVSNGNIDIAVVGNNFTAGGESLSLVVGVTNKNSSSLDLADLVVVYPKGSAATNTGDPTLLNETSRITLGTIPSGAVRNQNVNVTLFGEQGSIQNIKISLEYRVAGSNAIFVKDTAYQVTINSTPVNLTMDAPDTTAANQNITLNAKAILNATNPASKMLLTMDYPLGFQFISATPAPSSGNNIWSLGDMAPGAERDISVVGKIVDATNGEDKTFHVTAGTQSATNKYAIDVVFNSLSRTIAISKAFIDANLSINGAAGAQFAINTSSQVHASINWKNNSDTKVNDLQIQAKISGNAVDNKTINVSQGFYDSNQGTITWDGNSQSQLKEVNPGDSGTVEFSLSPLSLFSAASGILSSPKINIDVSVSGKQDVAGFSTTSLNNFATATVNVISDVAFTDKALYYSGAFTNTGPIPPAVGKATTYTIVWSVSNTANNISGVSVHSTLPPWISFVNKVSGASENLTFNATTQEVTWNIGGIQPGTGITKDAHSVSFQVSMKPSVSQVGSNPILINEAVLTGHDDFANVDISARKPALNTILSNDPTFPGNGSQVVN